MKRALLFFFLAVCGVAQTPLVGPIAGGGGGGGGGTGCVPAGSAGQILTDSGAGACTSNTTGTGILTALGLTPTGTGAIVLANTPTLITPVIGAATGTSLSLTGSLTTGSGSGLTGSVKISGTTSGQVTFTTLDAAGTWTFKVPNTGGSANQFLQTDGTGISSWASIVAANLPNAGVMTGDVTTTFPAVTVARVNGITYSATAAAHSVEVITTANTTATAKVIPDCTDTTGNHLNYTQSTDAFSCGTTSGTPTLAFPLTVSGTTTSGGIPYFSATTTLTSSALLAAGGLVIGGGAGAAPATFSTITADTTNANIRVGTSTHDVVVGDVSGLAGFPGIWMGANTASPTSTNYFVLEDGAGAPLFNTPSGKTISFRVNNATIGSVDNNGVRSAKGFMAIGSTFTASGCTPTSLVGGATAGHMTIATGVCSGVTVTMASATTAPNSWACAVDDITTPANLWQQSAAGSTTTAVFSGTSTANDVIKFHCIGY